MSGGSSITHQNKRVEGGRRDEKPNNILTLGPGSARFLMVDSPVPGIYQVSPCSGELIITC